MYFCCVRISERKKKAGRYCAAHGCLNEPVKKKGGLCHKHYKRQMKTKDAVAVRYNNFKTNAKRRGVEFRAFCKRTGYIITKGKRGQNATIDRRCNLHGYYIWNIQLLTNRQNASKGNRFSGRGFGPHDYEDVPF